MAEKKLKVFLTVDVECYTGDYEREVYGCGLGLDYILRVLRMSGARATFFIEALGATRWGTEPLRQICGRILESGHDAQLHAHPSVARLPDFRDTSDLMHGQDADTQHRLLVTGVEILKSCGCDVAAFRAGDLAANDATLEAMRRAGILKGSNRDLDMKCSTRSLLNDFFPVRNDVCEHHGILDVPISCFRSPLPILDGAYRHLEISAVGIMEMRSALCKMAGAGYSGACILTHPREFFRWRGGHAKAIAKNCRRLEWLANYVNTNPLLEWSSMANCSRDVAAAAARQEICVSLAWSLIRMVQQALA